MPANIYLNSHAKVRVLLIQLELPTWRPWARGHSYAAHLGLEEGLRANGVEYLTITTPWLSQAQDICAGKHFDQVWIEIVYNELDDAFLQWLATIAPVRIGFIGESLKYYPEEYAVLPPLKELRDRVERRLKYITHVVACDEKDAEDLNLRGVVPAIWWPQAVPERFVCEQATKKPESCAVFCGKLYAKRANWLESPDLKGLLVRLPSPEDATVYPFLFNLLHIAVRHFLRCRLPGGEKFVLPFYLHSLRRIRQQCFARWLEALQTGCAVVNLPHFVKTYAGRVVEAMAAARPVISWEIPDRPRNKALFEDGQEILLYRESDPNELVTHIQRILCEPDLGQRIVANARLKIRRFHTIEKRVQQILNWVETGENPTYV